MQAEVYKTGYHTIQAFPKNSSKKTRSHQCIIYIQNINLKIRKWRREKKGINQNKINIEFRRNTPMLQMFWYDKNFIALIMLC